MILSLKLFLANLLLAIFWKFNLAMSYIQIYWRKTTNLLGLCNNSVSRQQQKKELQKDKIYIKVANSTYHELSDMNEIANIPTWTMAHIDTKDGDKIVRIDDNIIPVHQIQQKSKADILQVSLYTGVSDPDNIGIDLDLRDYLYVGNQLLSKEFLQYYLDLKHPSLTIDLENTNYWVDVMNGNTFEIQQIDMNHYLEIGNNEYRVMLREEK